MPSDYFISNDGRDAALDSYLRLNFSFANEEDAQRGLAILVNLIKST
jgi:DNA-binding transcriptional MocR family regulator